MNQPCLQKGEFPVNIKKITQVFDGVVTIDQLPIDVPADKFVDLYNDLPNILTGYAIGATLSDESYREPDVSQITFQRLDRGTYWIFPTDRIGRQGAAWLVPNPLKDIKIDRNKSLNFSFDIDSSSQNNSNILILTKPALVQILPNSDRLTWKLTERGELRTGGTVSQPTTANNASIDPLALTKQIEHIVEAKLRSAHGDILKQCQELIDRSIKNSNERSVTEAAQPQMSAKEYFERGKEKEQKQDFLGALIDYNCAIEHDPDYANAYFNRGMLKKNSPQLKDPSGAISSLRTAARLYKQQGHLDIYQSLLETLQKLDV